MTDRYARALAGTANRNGTIALQRLDQLEHHVHQPEPRPRIFRGRCALCGQPSGRRRYCHAHRWAE